MIKQIFMIATAHPFTEQKAINKAFLQAEADLNSAINEGYTLFAHYPINANQLTGQMFVMYKKDPRQNTDIGIPSREEAAAEMREAEHEEADAVKRMMASGAPDEDTARAMYRKIEAAADEAERYFYPAGPDDTPHCKTCGTDILYCRCHHTKP